MDIEEFVQKHQPGMRASKLDKYAKEIKALKEKKYSDEQIREWLASNGLEISREAIRKYIRKFATRSQLPITTSITTVNESKPEEVAAIAPNNESQAEKLRRKLAEQQGDADKTRFKHDKSGNIK
jgi:sugar-specific transcriptional regulator TrmB